jgi:catechol 2,3-dioxygenase
MTKRFSSLPSRRSRKNERKRENLSVDRKPIVWTEAERRKSQVWGMKTIELFHAHGKPPV